jgi:hypothetical protein
MHFSAQYAFTTLIFLQNRRKRKKLINQSKWKLQYKYLVFGILQLQTVLRVMSYVLVEVSFSFDLNTSLISSWAILVWLKYYLLLSFSNLLCTFGFNLMSILFRQFFPTVFLRAVLSRSALLEVNSFSNNSSWKSSTLQTFFLENSQLKITKCSDKNKYSWWIVL